ncbi:DNA polymerase iota isoform X2 [Xenopus laevis]|uniref:DNA polymerase iota isoform X2 n=1 Tax=Xenopus laevis TaxID=8355 RepID=A0A8J0U9Y8_XENLA|nr:DNA polymerase iota isoform X2 [Xenopus laevis]
MRSLRDSEDEAEEEEEEAGWLCRAESPSSGRPAVPCSKTLGRSGNSPSRVIVHIDMDCFYAQVEMIRNPELRNKPLGIQQKYIVVTCNYEARKFGVTKLMLIKDAREKCPQLVLVSGEDLTPYREMSYKATELLEEFSPKVERLGFDENYIDVTELVDKKLQEDRETPEVLVCGHVYNDQKLNVNDWAHTRIAAGSHIASDIRAALYNRLGLTGCAGIASNKLLAKLVSGTHKPNQQTALLHDSQSHLINSLDHVKRIPGIGCKTNKRLESLGLSRISDLQACPVTLLEKEFGSSAAHRLQMLSHGEDDSPVAPSGPPQSISDEDSFKKCSTVSEVKMKMEERLKNLLIRIAKDGRSPHTLRLTIRQFSPTNKWFNRESRQCPIPPHIIQNIGTECEAVPALMDLLMRLFEKMINVKLPFHLTLLNVCFSNLKASNSSRRSIGFYLTQKAASAAASPCKGSAGVEEHKSHSFPHVENCPASHTAARSIGQLTTCVPTNHDDAHSASESLPEGIDLEVFSQLPEEIKQEIIEGQRSAAEAELRSAPKSQATPPKGILHFFSRAKAADLPSQHDKQSQTSSIKPLASIEAPQVPSINSYFFTKGKADFTPTGRDDSLRGPRPESHPFSSCYDIDPHTKAEPMDSCSSTSTFSVQSADVEFTGAGDEQEKVPFPHSVDVNVFSQLPEEVRRELIAEWKQLKPTLKIPVRKQSEKAKALRGKKTGASAGAGGLLKYFKPT